MGFAKQRLLWIGVVAVFIIIMVFGLAMMGSVLGARPKDLPVALVVLDQGAELGNGNKLAVGEMVKGKLLDNKEMPIAWKLVGSEEEARKGLDAQDYYGALVLPADLSAGLLSLQTPNPKPGAVKILINEGMNTQAATAVKQILGQVMKGIGLELSKQMLALVGQRAPQIPVSTAAALLAPITVEEQAVHPVGANNASGGAPNMLTQIMWLGSMVTSIFMFLAAQREKSRGSGRWKVVFSQTAAGLLIIPAASGFLIWMATSWYGMEIGEPANAWLFLWLAGTAFFLLQSALLNLLGMPAIGLLVLLLFFSMPLINMAPEFLPEATKDWLYSWTPFRFVTQGLRNIFYFGGTDAMSESYTVLWWLIGSCLVLLFASAFRKRSSQTASAAMQ